MRRFVDVIAMMVLVLGSGSVGRALAAEAVDLSSLIDLGALRQEEALFDEASVVVGASRYAQKTEEAPATVTVLTAEQIRRYGWRTLAEALRTVPGLYTSSDRLYGYVGVRGFLRGGDYNTRLLILVDGHRMNDNIYDSGFVDRTFPVDLDLIRRIEVIRGPASSSYGTNALLGVVNVITRDAGSLRGGEVAAATSSYGTLDRRLTAGGGDEGGPSWIGSYSSYNSAGQALYFPEFDDPSTNDGVAAGVDDERGYHAFAKVRSGSFTLEALKAQRAKQLAPAPWGMVFSDPQAREIDAHEALWLTWARRVGTDTDASVKVSLNRYTYTGTFPYDDGGVYLNRDESEGAWWGVETQVSRTTRTGHRLTAGTELRQAVRQDQSNFDLDPFTLYLSTSQEDDLWAVFVQDEYRPRKDLLINLGLRHDHYDSVGGTTNPRVAFIHEARRDTQLKLMWGQSFRAPNVFERFYADGVSYLANPELEPEETDSWELQWRRILSPATNLTVGLFRFGIDGLITQVEDPGDGSLQFVNLDSIESRGVEVEVARRLRGARELRASYTFQRATDGTTGATLPNAPRHLGKLSWLTPVTGTGLTAGIELLAMGSRLTGDGATAGGHTVTNLTLTGGRGDVDFTVGAYNLFDRGYADPVSDEFIQDTLVQDGRSVRVKVTCHF